MSDELSKEKLTEEWIEGKVNKLFAKLLTIHGAFKKPLEMRSFLEDFIRTLVEELS